MADSEEVLAQLGPVNDVEIIGIVVNEKGAERAIATKAVTTLGYPCSVSETFLRRNQNQSQQENRAVLEKIKTRADDAGLAMVAYISMAFGNPYGDSWSEKKVAEAVESIVGQGIRIISIADGGKSTCRVRCGMSAFRCGDWWTWWLSLCARSAHRKCADGRSIACVKATWVGVFDRAPTPCDCRHE